VEKKHPPVALGSRSALLGTIGPAALLVFATLVAYLPALPGGFIWNDSDYVTAPALRSVHGLARIWIEPGATQQYYPLLHSAFWVQYWFFGDNPLGYHIVTLLLHAGSAVLFALVLRKLFAGVGPERITAGIGHSAISPGDASAGPSAATAWLAALLFALHPVHVESVAWITEQKNTFSLVFYLGAVMLYLKFAETRRPQTYVAALVLFIFSLWCKTVTATLPAALLVVLWWKRGRIDWRRDIRPLLPWFAVGAASGLFSSWVEKTYIGAQGADFELSFVGRTLVAGRAIWFYAGKLVWPSALNFIYPRWIVDGTVWWQWLFPIGVLAVGAALWALRWRARAPLAVFLLFTGSLFPVLSFVNLYGARFSWVWDHWQYLADLAPLALAAAGLTAVWRIRLLGPALITALTLLLGALTWSHCRMFHDDQTLYRETLARNPDSWFAHNNLGIILASTPGRVDDAVAEYEEALRLKPDSGEAHNNLGNVLLNMLGRLDAAVAQYQEALRLEPNAPKMHYNLGTAWAKSPGRLNDAIAEYEEALRLKPDYADAHNNLGTALSQLPGRLDDAVAQYQEALRLEPDVAEVHRNLADAWVRVPGRLDDAIAEYEEALRLKPDYADAHNNLGLALSQISGRLGDAVSQYQQALRLMPNSVEAHRNLGDAWLMTPGRLDEAVAEYEEALRLKPDHAMVHYNLGNALSQIPGRLGDAVSQSQQALRLKPDFAPAWHNLGASWYNLGNFPAAVDAYREELRLLPNDPDAQQALAAALREVEEKSN
jgi:protein O-mannosyl-transferase